MKWYVTYTGVGDFGTPAESGITIITAENAEEALRKIINRHGYGFDDDDCYGVDRNKWPKDLTVEELWDYFHSMNGDGCDFVISIISDKGEVIYVTTEQEKPNEI
jgi:hypothetical protein